jgi:hypothetical protein
LPIPTTILELSQTAASNYPQGSDSPATLDDTQRAHGGFIATLRDGKGFSNPVTIASATTIDIGGQNSQFVEISGTSTITGLGATYNGPRYLRFTGALLLTHNATTLNLPGGASITTVAGDSCIAVPNIALSGWNVLAYNRAAGGGGTDYLNTTRIDVASATTLDLTTNAPNTRNINITGVTAITGVTVAIGQLYFVRFNAALTLTNNANIVTQTGSSITTAAGDTCILRATAANTVEVLSYVGSSGAVLLTGNQTIAGVKTFSSQPVLPQAPVLGTAVATTSGTSIDFTGIPSWVKRITLMLKGVSTNGTSSYLVRIGAGSIDSATYTSTCAYGAAVVTDTTGFVVANGVGASDVCSGRVTLTLFGSNTWIQDGIVSSNVVRSSSGDKALSGTLDRVRLTTVNGTDTLDLGSSNLIYEG